MESRATRGRGVKAAKTGGGGGRPNQLPSKKEFIHSRKQWSTYLANNIYTGVDIHSTMYMSFSGKYIYID